MDKFDIIKKYIMFSFNYPYTFIDKCWVDQDPLFIEHIRDIFVNKADYNMNIFFTMLDKENQEKLINWIFENYNN